MEYTKRKRFHVASMHDKKEEVEGTKTVRTEQKLHPTSAGPRQWCRIFTRGDIRDNSLT